MKALYVLAAMIIMASGCSDCGQLQRAHQEARFNEERAYMQGQINALKTQQIPSEQYPGTSAAPRRERPARTQARSQPVAPSPDCVWDQGYRRWSCPAMPVQAPVATSPAPTTVSAPAAPPAAPVATRAPAPYVPYGQGNPPAPPPMVLNRYFNVLPPNTPPIVQRGIQAGKLVESYQAVPLNQPCPYGQACLNMGWIPSGPGFRPPWP